MNFGFGSILFEKGFWRWRHAHAAAIGLLRCHNWQTEFLRQGILEHGILSDHQLVRQLMVVFDSIGHTHFLP